MPDNITEKDIVEQARVFLGEWTFNETGGPLDKIPSLLKELVQEVERHRDIMEMRVDKETLLNYFHAEAGAMDIAVEPPEFIRKLLAVLLLTAMDDAPNFQTAGITWKAEDYELTIRKIDGKSPAQLLGELRAENERLKRGDFTSEEFQNLCHNLSEENKVAFFEGCSSYQKKLFGSSAVEEIQRPSKCIHCDPAFDPQGPDDYCTCKCHIKEMEF